MKSIPLALLVANEPRRLERLGNSTLKELSINKIALSFVFAGILGATSAVAETDGAFVGVQAGYGANKLKMETDGLKVNRSVTATGFVYGFLGGYKQFFTQSFGARYYGVVNFGNFSKSTEVAGEPFDAKISTWNITANADALYNFVSSDSLDFGAFLGLSLGYANHNDKDMGPDGAMKPSGFDLGINFGLRTNIAQNHGIELYSRFGLLQQKKEQDFGGWTMTVKNQQPYAVGLRYTFSF